MADRPAEFLEWLRSPKATDYRRSSADGGSMRRPNSRVALRSGQARLRASRDVEAS
jgi:hypothetical protein